MTCLPMDISPSMPAPEQAHRWEDDDARWGAVISRDAPADGAFVFGVASTGIYCRPSCPARRPLRDHVSFFADGAAARARGLRPCLRCRPDEVSREQAAVAEALGLLGAAEAPLALAEVAARVGYSPSHFQRLFTRATGLSPAAYARALRMERARDALGEGGRVADALYDAGFGAASRFYEASRERLGMAPSAWVRGGAGEVISWAVVKTSLGPMLVAATAKGVCRLSFNEGRESLELRFPRAELIEGGAEFEALLVEVLATVERPGRHTSCSGDIPLDVRGTAFQEAVWRELRKIPRGETRSYAEIAAAVGKPGAVRAAGSANGANPVAVLIPCHRVVRSDGTLGGYAWGLEIKSELLAREKNQTKL